MLKLYEDEQTIFSEIILQNLDNQLRKYNNMELLKEKQNEMNYEEWYFDKADLHKNDLMFIIDEMLEVRQTNDDNALMVYNSLG